MKHFNTDQLRDYHFGLSEPQKASRIQKHLETCPDCRAKLERIEQQFAVLDVLKKQPDVSTELIASVLNVKPPRKVIPFRIAAILAAAAGIALIFGIFQYGQSRNGAPSHPSGRIAGASPSPLPTLAKLRAEKPFAPASNIELNVLPRRDDVQLTIYNAEDLTLVRETRKLVLKRGWNWLQFMWSNTLIDPTSLSLEPKTHANQIEITQLVYPPRLNELARWTIFSETDCTAEFELTYFTAGLKWKAFYEATLAPDEQSMQLRSFVRVDNGSGEDYENAETRLVVGEINLEEKIATLAKRQHPYERSMPEIVLPELMGLEHGLMDGRNLEACDKPVFPEEKEILKQALSEYQLYTIEGRETIPHMWGKRLPSFDVQEIGVTNLYKYDEERWGPNTMRFLSFANTEACKLGKNPLPDGYVRVFRTFGEDGKLSYVGATGIKYIPIGEEVELELGAAQKVKVESILMDQRTENYEFHTTDNPTEKDEMDDLFGGPHWYKGDICGWDQIENWQIKITNTKDVPVELEIMRTMNSSVWTLQTDTPYEKYDAKHIRFTVRLDPRSKQEINYEVTVKHGTRAN